MATGSAASLDVILVDDSLVLGKILGGHVLDCLIVDRGNAGGCWVDVAGAHRGGWHVTRFAVERTGENRTVEEYSR